MNKVIEIGIWESYNGEGKSTAGCKILFDPVNSRLEYWTFDYESKQWNLKATLNPAELRAMWQESRDQFSTD